MLPDYARQELNEALDFTKNNTGLNLVMALSYSGRWELLNAVKNIAHEVKSGNTEYRGNRPVYVAAISLYQRFPRS